MEQDALNEFQLHRRRMMGIPDGAGRNPNIRFDDANASILNEQSHASIREKFGHILGGALKDKIGDFDKFEAQNSPFFAAPPRINGKAPALETRNSTTQSMGRRNQRRGPQQPFQKVSDPKFKVPLADFGARKDGSEMAEIAQINAMLYGGESSTPSYRGPQGNLMPERGHNSSINLGDGYITSAPFNPMNQIMNRVAARNNVGVDYRDMESKRSTIDEHESTDDRYLSSTTQRGQPDARLMQEMARSMAEEMIRTVMQEHKGKKYFKEVKTTHKFDSPTATLVEIDGKYFRMDLKPVKLKTKR